MWRTDGQTDWRTWQTDRQTESCLVAAKIQSYIWAVRMVPIHFRWVVNVWVVEHTADGSEWQTGVSHVRGPSFAAGIQHMKQSPHNWHLSYCQCTDTCSHASSIQNIIYTPVPGISSPAVNFATLIAHCCVQCVGMFGWCQPVFDGWIMAEWF